ncbi:MAG: hypothetical protein J5I93_20335 [Pirellulaceae bacterium]|nr:hypothetical protein [Pirellulaceae bacterium]
MLLLLVSVANSQPTIGLNFQASDLRQSGFRPPDSMAAIGRREIVELINGRYAVYSKADGSVLRASTLNQFWSEAGVTPIVYAFDPRVLYDALVDRWFACAVDNSRAANSLLVAVSATGDPTQGWLGFRIDSDSDDSHWADFPMMGVNAEVLVITANMFPLGEDSTRTAVLVLPKDDLLVGNVDNFTLFEDLEGAAIGYSPQPVVDLDQGPLPFVLLSNYDSSLGLLKISTIGGTPELPVLNTDGGLVRVFPRGAPPDVDQPGPKTHVDAGDNRFCSNVVMRRLAGRPSPSLWAAHGIAFHGRAAIEWFEIDVATRKILQNGTLSDTSLAFNYPSLAINAEGDVVIGCSGGSPERFLSTFAFVGMTENGQTTFADPMLLKAGVSDYESVVDSEGRNRWGDYSATLVDPLNPTDFWTIQEFVSETNVWATQITQISLAVVTRGAPWLLNYPAPNTVWRLQDGTFQSEDGACSWSRVYGNPPEFAWVRGPVICNPPNSRIGLGLGVIFDGQLTAVFLQLNSPPLVIVSGRVMPSTAVGELALSDSAKWLSEIAEPAIPELQDAEVVDPGQLPPQAGNGRIGTRARSAPTARNRTRPLNRAVPTAPRTR